MSWNHSLDEAPLDRRLWLATKCGKVSVTRWNEKRGAWDGLASGEQPIAWQVYAVPVHPYQIAPSEERSEGQSLDGETVGANTGGCHVTGVRNAQPVSAGEAAASPDIILHKHIFLDDCGSGA